MPDVEETVAYLDALRAKLEAQEFEELMLGEEQTGNEHFRRQIAHFDTMQLRRLLLQGGRSALDELKLQRRLDELFRQYPPETVSVAAGVGDDA